MGYRYKLSITYKLHPYYLMVTIGFLLDDLIAKENIWEPEMSFVFLYTSELRRR